jgi:hypothetical protein
MSRIINTTVYLEDLCFFGVYNEIRLEVSGTVRPEVKERGADFNCAGGYPGEPECVEDLGIWMKLPDGKKINGNAYVDFEPFMSKKQIEACEEKLIELYYDAE